MCEVCPSLVAPRQRSVKASTIAIFSAAESTAPSSGSAISVEVTNTALSLT